MKILIFGGHGFVGKHLAEELVQIIGTLNFSRTAYQIGIGKWSSTAILKDKAKITTNLFLFKE